MCALSFTDGSHCNFHLYTKSSFLQNVLYAQKAKQINPVHVRIYSIVQILRALLRNNNRMSHF